MQYRNIIYKIVNKIQIIFINEYWTKNNKNNYTRIGKIGNIETLNFIKSDRINVGDGTYGVLNIHTSGNSEEKLCIGKYCQISGQSHFLLGGEHNYKYITTYPCREIIFKNGKSSITKGSIVLDDEVWIGCNALIMSGVHVGKGAVVAAGAVVTKDVEPYTIVGGVPAKVIKKRFSEKVIDKLIELDIPYNNLSGKDLEKLEIIINDDNVDDIIKYFKQRS